MNKEREEERHIYKKEESILGDAEYHNRNPMPSITPGARPPPRHGDWWRPMEATSHQARSHVNNAF